MRKVEIVNEIEQYISGCKGMSYSNYYIGIAKDPRHRLFKDHEVKEDSSCWIFRPADNINIARDIEKYFLNKGMKGGSGGGDDTSTFVYCYEITKETKE